MHRPPRNHAVRSALVSLPRGWELDLVVIMEVEVGMGEEEVVIIVVKEFIVGIRALKPNLFRLVARVSCRRVYKRESKLIATYLTAL